MGAKCKSKTHLLNTFLFLFLAPFFARLASKFEKVQIWPTFFLNNKKGIKKLILLISNPLKKFLKNEHKVMSKKGLGKSGKSAHFRHVFAKHFFGTFFKTFSTDFFKLWMQMRTRRLKKTKNLFFYKRVMEPSMG